LQLETGERQRIKGNDAQRVHPKINDQ